MSDCGKRLIVPLECVGLKDIALVGGKNAALGELLSHAAPLGISVPGGFVVTTEAYRYFLDHAGIGPRIAETLAAVDVTALDDLARRGAALRQMILDAPLPPHLREAIADAYRIYDGADVAVRSSATAEDLAGASFAGQQETYLNVRGIAALCDAVRRCMASLFTDRAISYRAGKGFASDDLAIAIGVQRMVRSDVGASGVLFTIDTETGFDKVVVINASYGLGEILVQGRITPDEFIVFKPSLRSGKQAIIARQLGTKEYKMIYGEGGTDVVPVPDAERERFCLADHEVCQLARWAVAIEEHFRRINGTRQAMDIEWAKDGRTGGLCIVQARPETVHSVADPNVYKEYRLREAGRRLLEGIAIGTRIAAGPVRVIRDVRESAAFRPGEVLVTTMTNPDWEPVMKMASAIVTDAGGRTSHAAIVSRELGIPAIVAAANATTLLEDGMEVTVDCSDGKTGVVYEGRLAVDTVEHRLDAVPETMTKVMVNIGSPEEAFKHHHLPVKGVGLGRLEFIISGDVQIHPNALIAYEQISRKDPDLAREIERRTRGYADKTQFYVDRLAMGIAKIGAAFWPHEVIIRFSDFKSNEYRTLKGGEYFEPVESNPMLGWRGASRYYDPKFQAAFGLECRAVTVVREIMGLANVMVMVPFCRTPEEGRRVIEIMGAHGLDRARDRELKIYVMCEIPSNVIEADAFLDIFDGMSIGSNDLTQLTLGMDRDSGALGHVANENNTAVQSMIRMAIQAAHARSKYIGICGQAPSDFPEFAEFLVEQGIGSMSLNPDSVIRTLSIVAEAERKHRLASLPNMAQAEKSEIATSH